MIVFVILHYMTVQNTVSEITHISDELVGNKKIVVVDNASPNDSGTLLAKKYKNDSLVRVILNKKNLGFARGMNIGYKEAQVYNPDFVVLLNNDIEFTQKNFIDLVLQSYQDSRFAVLGPDIVVPETKTYQNPKKNESYSIQEVQRIYERNKKILDLPPSLLHIRADLKQFKFLRLLVRLFRRQNKNHETRVLKNVVLHGSIMVFSKDFMNVMPSVFDPDTFFYFETEILDRVLREKGLVSKYDPSIKILHHQSSSTKQSFAGMAQRQQFQVTNMIKSSKVFMDKFKSESGKQKY